MPTGTRPAYPSLQAYFTDAPELRSLMLRLLGNVSGQAILEPSAGVGAFVSGFTGTPLRVDAVEIDPAHIRRLKKLPLDYLRVISGDFLKGAPGGEPSIAYDAVISNPPYGLYLSLAHRAEIKKRQPRAYARESYGLFMHFSLDRLKSGGRYVFIVPDTFFTSRNHRSLRERLVKNAAPTHMVQFKSRRFGSVDFGYANLCIIAGNKRPLAARDKVFWVDARNSDADLTKAAFDRGARVAGRTLLDTVDHGWVRAAVRGKAPLSRRREVTLGDLADCRTGLYTGDNKAFLGFARGLTGRVGNGHPIAWNKAVVERALSRSEKEGGLSGSRSYVPFVRGGHRAPLEATRWALRWSRSSVARMKTNRKARVQNASFYFRRGLAVPMVTSGRLSASEFSGAIFDQGVVGVFPRNPALHDYLLLYLNSPRATQLKRALFPSTNNSANYLKRLPVPPPRPADLAAASKIVADAREKGWESTEEARRAFMKRFA